MMDPGRGETEDELEEELAMSIASSFTTDDEWSLLEMEIENSMNESKKLIVNETGCEKDFNENQAYDILKGIRAHLNNIMSRMDRAEQRQLRLEKIMSEKLKETKEIIEDQVDLNWNSMINYVQEQVDFQLANNTTAFNENKYLSSTQVRPQTNFNKFQISRMIREELARINQSNETANGNSFNVSKELTETIKSQVSRKTLKRDYKLTSKTKFEHFLDYFMSELLSYNLQYVIDKNIKLNNNLSESMREKHKFRVRNILINRIDSEYHSKIMESKDPVEMLQKIKNIKRCEVNLTSSTIRKQLHNIIYIPSKEKATAFIDRFEKIVRNYNNLSGMRPLSEEEKRDAFLTAVAANVPRVQKLDFMAQETGGLSYEKMKNSILQIESIKTSASGILKETKSVTTVIAANVKSNQSKIRCYTCDSYGHMGKDCPNAGTNLRVCFQCKQLTSHIAAQCPQRLAKGGNSKSYDNKVDNANDNCNNKRKHDNDHYSDGYSKRQLFNRNNRQNEDLAYVTTRGMKKKYLNNTELRTNDIQENEANDISDFINDITNDTTEVNYSIENNTETSFLSSDFENTIVNRKLHQASDLELVENVEHKFKGNIKCNIENVEKEYITANCNKAMLWHARMGHASLKYLQKLQKKYPQVQDLRDTVFDDSILDCEVCMISKIKKLPFNQIRQKATEPLQIIHSDTIGMISPASYPMKYKYISVFIDDHSKLAMAYPMITKDETATCFDQFIKSARNILGRDAKVCFLCSDQSTEYTGNQMAKILEKYGTELQMACPDTPQHNGVLERFNQTIQKKVRSLIYDSGLPENMWDLALGAAVYAYNRTPHASIEMNTPIQVFKPDYKVDLNHIKRFGCLTYMKVPRKIGPNFKVISKRVILVGYRGTGFVLFSPEEGKLFESKDVRFNEKSVFRDKHKFDDINNWEKLEHEYNSDKWFIEFKTEEATETSRSRGRPKK